ncbi:MAG: hypothetical protein IPL79_02470 [Myxococcales bacterium]|nr:hypothetical protein [Myxococcales bacterium]
MNLDGSRWPTFAILVGLAMATTACMPKQNKLAPLQDAIGTYNDGIKWERFTAAAAHVQAAERDDFLDERDGLAKYLRITGYDIVRVDLAAGSKTAADVVIKFEWYDDRKGMLRESHVAQTWEQQKGRWWVVKEALLRGDEMPGILPKEDDLEQPKEDAAAASAAADLGPAPTSDAPAHPQR